MSEWKKRAPLERPPVPAERDKKPPKTEIRTAVRMPGKTLTSRLIKPVGAAIAILIYSATGVSGASTSISAPQGAMPADPAQTLITGAVAPFACAATKGGVYIDTTCAEVCACVTADAKWARSDTGVEGTATDCCPPPTTTTSTTTTTTTLASVVLPMAGPSDVNCPTTIPTANAQQAGWVLYIAMGQTCPTGANAAGYNVTSISPYVGTAVAGKHLRCSVYDAAGPPRNHLAAGCDSVEATVAATTNAFITLATSGTCHLAAATRYWVACQTDDSNLQLGNNTAACTSCWAYAGGQSYPVWPATFTSGGTYNVTPTMYLTATPGP